MSNPLHERTPIAAAVLEPTPAQARIPGLIWCHEHERHCGAVPGVDVVDERPCGCRTEDRVFIPCADHQREAS